MVVIAHTARGPCLHCSEFAAVRLQRLKGLGLEYRLYLNKIIMLLFSNNIF